MRLRRETGDFQIKVTFEGAVATVNSINKNLRAEDFIGQVVDVDGIFEVITKATENNATVTAHCETVALTYTKATGAITAGTDNTEGTEPQM